MVAIFHPGADLNEVRGLIEIIRESGKDHRISMYMLAEESEKDVDDLLPMVEACRMLGLAKVAGGNVQLTAAGMQLNMGNFHSRVGRELVRLEPFKSALAILSEYDHASTKALLGMLQDRGIHMGATERENEDSLRKLLMRWGVRCRVLDYNHRSDTWKKRRK